MDKKQENVKGEYPILFGLETEQIRLLCLMAYLGETPGDYALRQLYGRNFSTAKRNLDVLDRSSFTRDGKVAPKVYFDVVGIALDNFEIPESVEFLGNYVFLRSNILKTLVCRPTTPPAKMVYGIPSEGPIYLSDSIQIETIYVPMESVVEYKNDSVWQVYSDIITGL